MTRKFYYIIFRYKMNSTSHLQSKHRITDQSYWLLAAAEQYKTRPGRLLRQRCEVTIQRNWNIEPNVAACRRD